MALSLSTSVRCGQDVISRRMPLRLQSVLVGVMAHWRAAMARHRQRRRLLELDDRMLADIGITREQAVAEGGKAPWRR